MSKGLVHGPALLGLVFATVCAITLGTSGNAGEQLVKKSKSGICHCPGGQYYDRTSNYTAYDAIEACLASGGRHPKRGQGQCSAARDSHSNTGKRQSLHPAAEPPSKAYDRNVFGGWDDEDGDCQNTRHERLIDLSMVPVDLSENGCQVEQGHWSDPANLLAVEASVNRDKGTDGPLTWLPPSTEFHCEYLLRFTRITTRYELHHTPREREALEQLTAEKCD